MNILSAEVCSLEAVNSGSRNVQTQFTVCSLKLTFSCFIWFHPCVSVGPTPQSLNISFEWPWKWNRKWLDLHSPPWCPPHCSPGESKTCGWKKKKNDTYLYIVIHNAERQSSLKLIQNPHGLLLLQLVIKGIDVAYWYSWVTWYYVLWYCIAHQKHINLSFERVLKEFTCKDLRKWLILCVQPLTTR